MTLTELHALSDEALRFEVARMVGYQVFVDEADSKWPSYKFAIPGKEYSGYWYSTKEKALSKCPRFTRSLDACAPLLDEMGEADQCVRIGAGPSYSSVAYHHVAASRPEATIRVDGKPSTALPRALCIAYVLFKQGQQQTT